MIRLITLELGDDVELADEFTFHQMIRLITTTSEELEGAHLHLHFIK